MIPARLGSERLPRKPLQLIAGRPLVEWVWRCASSLRTLDVVVVATDSEEVAGCCRGFGAEVELTSAAHESGTERVAEVAARSGYEAFDVVVNVQGDEPFVTEEQVAGCVSAVRAGFDIGTVATPLLALASWRDPAVVKVVRNGEGSAMYFTRAPVPHARGRSPSAAELASPLYLRHIGVYAYSRPALAQWVALPVSGLERLERLEQLRALEAGLSIGVTVVSGAEGGIDTPEDLARAEERLSGSSGASGKNP